MKFQRTLTLSGLLAGSLLLFPVAPVHGFSFRTNFTGDDPKHNIFLDSVSFNGREIDTFSLITDAQIISNDRWTGGSSGAASADLGDFATIGRSQERVDNAGVVDALGNRNLNSIIDTEDSGSFVMDLFFERAVDNLFFWERGRNSKLGIQALDSKGNTIGNLLTLNSKNWQSAGFSIDTKEIGEAQQVASLGVNLDDLGVSEAIAGLRVTSNGKTDNGPDFKVAGSEAARVPEPATLAGLGFVAGIMLLSRRKITKQA